MSRGHTSTKAGNSVRGAVEWMEQQRDQSQSKAEHDAWNECIATHKEESTWPQHQSNNAESQDAQS